MVIQWDERRAHMASDGRSVNALANEHKHGTNTYDKKLCWWIREWEPVKKPFSANNKCWSAHTPRTMGKMGFRFVTVLCGMNAWARRNQPWTGHNMEWVQRSSQPWMANENEWPTRWRGCWVLGNERNGVRRNTAIWARKHCVSSLKVVAL